MARRDVRLALIYQAEALHQHLRGALTELGATVVYEAHAHAFDRNAFERSKPEVVVITLEGGDDFAPLEDLLADDSRRVIFDDGEVSGRLQGWDLARWTRHLAAKVLDVADVHPPRPDGAVAVPVRVKAGPAGHHDPRGGAAFELKGAELEHALAADTGAAIELTRAELITGQEPVWAELEPGAFDNPEWSLDSESGPELEQPVEGDVTAGGEPTVELEFSTDALADFVDAAPRRGDETLEIDFDPASLQDFGQPQPEPRRPDAPTLELEFDSDTVAFRELAPGETHRWSTPDEVIAEAASGSYIDDAFKALGFIDIDAEVPPARTGEDVVDLETLLQQASELEQERSRGSIGKSADELAAARARDAAAANSSAKASEAARAAAVAAAKPVIVPDEPQAAPAMVQAPPKPKRSLQDFEAALAGLSLAPIDGETPPGAAPPTEAKTPPAEKRTVDFGSSFGGLALEPIEGEEPARPAVGRASFNLPPQPQPTARASVPPPAPVAARPSAAVAADDGLSLEGFEFTFEPRATPAAAQGEDLSVDLDSEIESLLARESAAPAREETPRPREAVPLQHVWVLGASIGGPDAVREFLGALPAGIPVVFLLAQHVGADFLELMVAQLTKAVRLRVRNASNGGVLSAGEVVVVPLAERLLIGSDGTMEVGPSAEASSYSPSIDQALRDVADRFGAKAGAIIFSGMARDAIDGAKYLKAKGGRVWVQDPSTCVISSMVDGAREAGIVEFSGSPQQLAQKFIAEFGAANGSASTIG